MRLRHLLPATCLVLATCAACGSSAHHPGAAEPATAPPTASAPAGFVRAVGADPEGIAYDARYRLVAVAVHDPDRLLLLDPATLAVRRTVDLPGSARHLQLDGDTVLVPAETADQLVQVPLPTGTQTVTDVLKQPHDAAAADGDVVVGDEFGKALSVIRDGRVVRTIRGLTQPGGVIGDGTTVVAVDVGAFRVDTYSLPSGRRTGSIAAGAGPTHGVLLTGDRVLVADTRGNEVLEFGLHPLRRIGRLALPGTPYGLADDRSTGTVWVTLTALNEVVGLDVRGATPKVIARYPTVRQPNTVAVAPGSRTLWITGTHDGQVQRIER